MIQSMTGYGKAEMLYNNKKIRIEIKSLNSKNADISTRIASCYFVIQNKRTVGKKKSFDGHIIHVIGWFHTV